MEYESFPEHVVVYLSPRTGGLGRKKKHIYSWPKLPKNNIIPSLINQ